MYNKYILSYPKSGNHLIRFFIELLTGNNTYGCVENKKDIPLNKNNYPLNVDFNIKPNNKIDCYHKIHQSPEFLINSNYIEYRTCNETIKELIILVRNPKEVIASQILNRLKSKDDKSLFEFFTDVNSHANPNSYFTMLQYYINFKGKKNLFYYEDIIKNPEKSIMELCNFLNITDKDRINYVLKNLDLLLSISKCGTNRSWHGVNSNLNYNNYYYNKLDDNTKLYLDTYINICIDVFKINELQSFIKIYNISALAPSVVQTVESLEYRVPVFQTVDSLLNTMIDSNRPSRIVYPIFYGTLTWTSGLNWRSDLILKIKDIRNK